MRFELEDQHGRLERDDGSSLVAEVGIGAPVGQQPPQGEPNRSPLGEGNLPLAEVVSTLESAGYTGYYDVELMGEEIEQTGYEELVTRSKTAFEKLIGA